MDSFRVKDLSTKSQELEDHGWENDKLPVDPEFVWDLLLQLDIHVSMWLQDGIHPRIFKSWLMPL